MTKFVLTGAAGTLGSRLRAPLAAMCDTLVSTDIVPLSDPLANETLVQADLSDLAAVEAIMDGADQVIHFGNIADEASWDEILKSNIISSYNIWEAAHRAGTRRVVYASSIHAVGMHPKNVAISATSEHRPDTYYGLSKCFTEDLARMYWEKRGLEAVCLRIYSCTEPVANARALGSWLSYADMVQLVQRSVDTPLTGFTIVYGVSDNDRCPVDNSAASFLGYRPQDNAEAFAAQILAGTPPMDPRDLTHACHGGPFATIELGQSAASLTRAQGDDT